MSTNLYSSKVHPRRVFPVNNWIEGISDFNKQGGSFVWARGVDYRTDPSQIVLLPEAVLEAGGSTFTDLVKWSEQVVGRTVILGNNTNLIANPSFETNTTGWTLGADYTRASDDSYLGTYSIKQVSTGGTLALTTASGSGLAVTAYADYQLTFYAKISVSSGLPAQLQVFGGSLSGPNLLSAPYSLVSTTSVWMPITITFNAGQYTSVFISIANQSGTVSSHFDFFTLTQINSLATFAYGNTGALYKRYSNGAWVNLGSIANSHGNGMGYYGEDDFLYVLGDTTVGRYGPISSGTPSLTPDFLTAAGGVPTNTNSVSLIAANSDYAVKTIPAAALKITSDIALEAFIKPTSLPAVGSSMTIMGLWKETGNLRAWKLDLYGISGYFGNGQDGSLTISVDTTEAPIDAVCSGTSGTNQLNANNGSFAAGQIILIMQMQGTGSGTYQKTTIQSYDGTNHIITTTDNLNFSYNSSGSNAAQVRVIPQYTNVTINAGVNYKPKAWTGSVGGLLIFQANGTLTVNGTINGSGKGFRGGTGVNDNIGAYGEGELAIYDPNSASDNSTSANGSGGGGGQNTGKGGGGGGYSVAGSQGGGGGGSGGNANGSTTNLTTAFLGAGGGGGGSNNGIISGSGANGGAYIEIIAAIITLGGSGAINANGAIGSNSNTNVSLNSGGGGGGSGGGILLKFQSGTLGTNQITASGGVGGNGWGSGTTGGTGADGRIHADYLTSFTGTTSPTLDSTQDTSLVTSNKTQLRLGISNDGTSFEYLAQVLQSIQVATWERVQVSWQASTSTASFYESGSSIGTVVGTKTAIYGSSTADFAIGANYTSAYANFFDGLVNDARVWNTVRTQAQLSANNFVNLAGISSGLVGNWFLTNTGNDLTSNADNLTLTGTPTPVYVTDVPYAGATTRLDIDQTSAATGFDYDLPTSLTEGQSKTFVPALDPQKSLQVNINAKGTGDWTLVVHNGLNQSVATVTVLTANLPASGNYEFLYPQVFSPVVGATYHFHLYSTVNDGSVICGADDDATTIQFTTYYQFLLSDTEYHPAMQMGNVLGIGNGRYLAVQDAAAGYNSRRLRFPAGWRVRALATWRGYYAIGCWKGTSIKDFDQGIVFLWDGYSITYNDFFFVPEGGVNAMYGENGVLYIVAGYKGDLLEYTGGDQAVKVKRLPKIGKTSYMEVSPGAITYYGALLRIGVSYNSDSTTIERGVYTWGTLNEKYPKSLSYDYPPSTGNRGSTVKIGSLVPVGGSLLAFFQDNTSFGVNKIDPSNTCQTSGTIEELITDFNFVWKGKDLQTVRADHLPLPAGANVDVKYKINYEASWHNLGTTNQAIDDQSTRLPITPPSTEYHTLQIAVDLTATQGNSPTILEHSHLSDLLLTETDEHATY